MPNTCTGKINLLELYMQLTEVLLQTYFDMLKYPLRGPQMGRRGIRLRKGTNHLNNLNI